MAQGNSNNRNRTSIASSVTANQHTLSNDSDNALDAGTTEPLPFLIGVSNALTLDQSETQGGHSYDFADHGTPPTATCTVTVNATTPRGTFWVTSSLSTYDLVIEISGQSRASPRLKPGTSKCLNHDGNDVFETVGFATFWVAASDMVARTTLPAAAGSFESTTNKVMRETFDFATGADEFVQYARRMSKRWDGGVIYFTPVWAHAAASTFGVAWFFQAVAFADGDALDTAYGTAIGSVDTGGTTDDVYIGPETAAVTVANTPLGEKWVSFQVYRDTSDGGDDLDVDARLVGFEVRYGVDSLLDD